MTLLRRSLLTFGAISLAVSACAGGTDDATATSVAAVDLAEQTDQTEQVAAETGVGIRLIDIDQAASVFADQPADLVVLDVRTTEEFNEGHLDGAIMIDFYGDDFADRLAELDPDVPYLLYCRSGNRSGQTRAMMEDLGFADVADVDGGVLAWADAGLPLKTP